MNSQRSMLTTAAISIGWVFFVIAVIFMGDRCLGLWRHGTEELANAQERSSRLQGWIKSEKQISAKRREVLGPFAQLEGSDPTWLVLGGLQQAAQAKGLSVTELRPSHIAGAGRQMPMLRLDVKIEGQMESIDGFLQQLPEKVPGIHLEQLQLMSRESGRIQSLLRLSVQERGQ